MSVMLETSLGELVIDLEVDLCPRTCENFLKLCKVKYYALNAFFNGGSSWLSYSTTEMFSFPLWCMQSRADHQYPRISSPKLVTRQQQEQAESPSLPTSIPYPIPTPTPLPNPPGTSLPR